MKNFLVVTITVLITAAILAGCRPQLTSLSTEATPRQLDMPTLTPAPTPKATPTPIRAFAWLAPSEGRQCCARISGDTVVWVQEEPSAELGTSDRVWVKSLSTGKAFAISNTSGTQTSPDVSGDVVVWGDTRNSCPTCERDIYGYRLSTGQEFSIVVGPNDQTSPSISGSVVVWEEADNQTRAIHGLDLASGEALEIASTPVDGHSSYGLPVIDGNIVVYEEMLGRPRRAGYSDIIYAYNFKTGTRSKVAEVSWPGLGSYYAISGNRVAWAAGMMHVFDLFTGQDTELPSQPYSSMVDIEGDQVVWSDSLPGDNPDRLVGYDLSKEKLCIIYNEPDGDQVGPRLSGTTVVWMSSSRHENYVSNIAIQDIPEDCQR